MTREQWENDLLVEADALDGLSKLFATFIDLLDQTLIDNCEYLDEDLVGVMAIVSAECTIVLERQVKYKGKKVPGILKQLEDVMDEVQTLQAGKETKHGIPDEDIPEDDSG